MISFCKNTNVRIVGTVCLWKRGKGGQHHEQLSYGSQNTPLQIELELIHTKSHESKNTPEDHMLSFYKTFDEVKEQNWDGLIITGAPVELMDFEEVEYLSDKHAGLPIAVPKNYYPKDDDTKDPVVTWRAHANLLYSNWLNYFVCQTSPYDITRISNENIAYPEPIKLN